MTPKTSESLGEDICMLIIGVYKSSGGFSWNNLLTNEETINLDMLGSFMKYWFRSNPQSSLIITNQHHGFYFTKLQLLMELF